MFSRTLISPLPGLVLLICLFFRIIISLPVDEVCRLILPSFFSSSRIGSRSAYLIPMRCLRLLRSNFPTEPHAGFGQALSYREAFHWPIHLSNSGNGVLEDQQFPFGCLEKGLYLSTVPVTGWPPEVKWIMTFLPISLGMNPFVSSFPARFTSSSIINSSDRIARFSNE